MDQRQAYDLLRKSDSAAFVYENSWAADAGAPVFAARLNGADYLIACGREGLAGELGGGKPVADGFAAYPMDHQNRLALNGMLPHTAPVSLADSPHTFGVGDRLGLANYAHIKVMENSDVKPVLAQQSMRELLLTGRSYKDVLDAAAWSAFKAGWKGGYGADGDHLKDARDIKGALADGYTMITLDCSENLKTPPADHEELVRAYRELGADYTDYCEKTYLENALAAKLGVKIDKTTLMRAAVAFKGALAFIEDIYFNVIKKAGRRIDFEISVDETPFETDPAAHFFVAGELRQASVAADSMAPRFVGEFQKGVDYIGDVREFHDSFAVHCAIAREFGYKISVHSGSDKFSIYPSVAELTRGRFHVKTAGTSWLEAVRVIAGNDPALYRRMHSCALDSLEEAKKLYVVHCDPARVKPLNQVVDADLPSYMEQDDARQLMHITYGSLFAKGLKPDIYAALAKYGQAYDAAIYRHIGKHIKLLGRWVGAE